MPRLGRGKAPSPHTSAAPETFAIAALLLQLRAAFPLLHRRWPGRSRCRDRLRCPLFQERLDRFVILPQLALHQTYVVRHVLILGIELSRSLVFRQRLGILVFEGEDRCKSEMSVGVVWIEFQKLCEGLPRLVRTLLLKLGISQKIVGVFVARIQRDHLLQLRFRFRKIVLDRVSARQLHMGRPIVRMLADYGTELRDGVVGFAFVQRLVDLRHGNE